MGSAGNINLARAGHQLRYDYWSVADELLSLGVNVETLHVQVTEFADIIFIMVPVRAAG